MKRAWFFLGSGLALSCSSVVLVVPASAQGSWWAGYPSQDGVSSQNNPLQFCPPPDWGVDTWSKGYASPAEAVEEAFTNLIAPALSANYTFNGIPAQVQITDISLFREGWAGCSGGPLPHFSPGVVVATADSYDVHYTLISAAGWTADSENYVSAYYVCPPGDVASQGNCLSPGFRIALSGGMSIEPSGTASQSASTSAVLTATVTDQTGAPAPGHTVTVGVQVVQYSGGHQHDNGARPKGTLSPTSGVTDSAGRFQFTFAAPEVSGTHFVTATCDNCSSLATTTIDVKVNGLTPLSESPNMYQFIGGKGSHPDNHYLTPDAAQRAFRLAYCYKDPFDTASLLRYNDASLVWGGRFDNNGDWRSPHDEHRRGTVMDVRANGTADAIPARRYKDFEKCVREVKASILPEFLGKSNGHYHVRLMGRSE